MKFSVFQVSRKGGRQINEDRMGYCYTRHSGLFLVADGMGGHPQGEVAAQLALQTISAMYQRAATALIDNPKEFIGDAILAAHRQILRYALDHDLHDSPRTTIVVALIQDGMASWGHCGDSRLYLVRHGELSARTRDHSYSEQRAAASTDSRPLPLYPNRNILYTCLGSPTKPVIDLKGPVYLEHGDRIMLCSDGLWGSVSDDAITRMVSTGPIAQAVPDLVEEALKKAGGNSDNVTVLALEWEGLHGPDEPTRSSISTDDIDDGVFASTMQANDPYVPAELDDLDDAAIERSIAEINEAIRRSAARRR
jgi:PPM family protein phosphatase